MNAGSPKGRKIDLKPELVFEEKLQGNEHRVFLALVPADVPYVQLPKLPGSHLTAVIYDHGSESQPTITAFYTSEFMARYHAHLATEGFRALCLLHDAAAAMEPVTTAVKALSTKEAGTALCEQMETALAEARRVLARAAELADAERAGSPH